MIQFDSRSDYSCDNSQLFTTNNIFMKKNVPNDITCELVPTAYCTEWIICDVHVIYEARVPVCFVMI